jgi:hypothetical protein
MAASWAMIGMLKLGLGGIEASAQEVPDSLPCPLVPVDSFAVFPLVPADGQDELRRKRVVLCRYIREATHDTRKQRSSNAARILDAYMVRESQCRGGDVNPYLTQHWGESPGGRALERVFNRFCQATRHERSSFEHLVDRVRWLRTESFCQTTRYFVDPGGWRGLFKLDTPSWRKLEETSSLLCNELRTRHISYGDATFRWNEETLWAREHLPKEIGQKAASDFTNTLKNAAEFLPKLVGLLK